MILGPQPQITNRQAPLIGGQPIDTSPEVTAFVGKPIQSPWQAQMQMPDMSPFAKLLQQNSSPDINATGNGGLFSSPITMDSTVNPSGLGPYATGNEYTNPIGPMQPPPPGVLSQLADAMSGAFASDPTNGAPMNANVNPSGLGPYAEGAQYSAPIGPTAAAPPGALSSLFSSIFGGGS